MLVPSGPWSLHGGHTAVKSLDELFGCNMLTVVVSGGMMAGARLNIGGMIAMNI